MSFHYISMKLTSTSDAMTTRMSKPVIDMAKFDGIPVDYLSFCRPVKDMILLTRPPDLQKLSRLGQLWDRKVKETVIGYKGMFNSLSDAFHLLCYRFRQPHITINVCIILLTEVSNFSLPDKEGFSIFVDDPKRLCQTLATLGVR